MGDYTVVWNATKGVWYYTGGGITICFFCVAGAFFTVSIYCSENATCVDPMGSLAGTCSPFLQSGTIVVTDSACGCSGTKQVAVTVTG